MLRGADRDPGRDVVPSAREAVEHRSCLLLRLRLAEHLTLCEDEGVGRDEQGILT